MRKSKLTYFIVDCFIVITFKINTNDLKFFDDRKQEWTVEPGKFKAYIAASSDDIRGTLEFEYK